MNDRFVLHEVGHAPWPGQCIVCATVDRPMVDFGANNVGGAILICKLCYISGLELFPFDIAKMSDMENALDQLEVATAKQRNFDVAIDEFRSAVASASLHFNDTLDGITREEEARQPDPTDLFGISTSLFTTD